MLVIIIYKLGVIRIILSPTQLEGNRRMSEEQYEAGLGEVFHRTQRNNIRIQQKPLLLGSNQTSSVTWYP